MNSQKEQRRQLTCYMYLLVTWMLAFSKIRFYGSLNMVIVFGEGSSGEAGLGSVKLLYKLCPVLSLSVPFRILLRSIFIDEAMTDIILRKPVNDKIVLESRLFTTSYLPSNLLLPFPRRYFCCQWLFTSLMCHFVCGMLAMWPPLYM